MSGSASRNPFPDGLLFSTTGPAPIPSVPGFSTTNLQEAGVDEADPIQFDGEFLYVAATGSAGGPPAAAIRILRASDDPARAEEVGEIEIPGIAAVRGLYVLLGRAGAGDVRLLVLGWAPGSAEPGPGSPLPWDWSHSQTSLHLFDVRDPVRAQELWSLVLDGELVASRRVEETLHLVTRATPVFPRVDASAPAGEAELLGLQEQVQRASRADLLPRVAVDGAESQPQVSPDRCLLGIADSYGLYRTPVLVTITSIDLRRPRQLGSLCMGAVPEQVYSSTESLYLVFRAGGPTVIHKFAYTPRGPEYRGVGAVSGPVVGAQQGFSLGEHQGVLGVVTDQALGGDGFIPNVPRPIPGLPPIAPRPIPGLPIALPPAPPGGSVPQPTPPGAIGLLPALPVVVLQLPMSVEVPVLIPPPAISLPIPDPVGSDEPELGRYRLTLLRESQGERFLLEEVSHLPSPAEPEPIGKPGDFIHGVRFMGERLYVVTYRKVDPLYAIDLRDPEAPRIVGQLQVPGFSDYLHPIGSGLLLGVGFDTLPDERNDWFQGIKVELFDVSDPAALQSLDAVAVGRRGSHSAALGDHHAVSHLPAGADGIHRFAVPIQVHDREPLPSDRPTTRFPWLHTGLYLFEVDETAAELREVGALVAAEPVPGGAAPGQGTQGDRSVLQGAAVHYVHGGRVWSAPWEAPEDAFGPQ
jgi:hypothetical protein